MKHIKLFEQFISKDYIISDIKRLSSKVEESEILSELNLNETILYSTFDNPNKNLNEGLLSKLRDKIKELTSKKSDISGEGSMAKKQKFQKAIEIVKNKLEDVKQDYQDEKEQLEVDGFVKTSEDRWDDADESGFPPVEKLKDPDGNVHYYIMGKEKLKNIFDIKVKKFKEAGLFRWRPKDGQEFPDKNAYSEIEPIQTPTGKTIFYVKRKVKNIDDKIADIENKLKELDNKFEDEFDGDASSDFYSDTYEPTRSKLQGQLNKLKKQKETDNK